MKRYTLPSVCGAILLILSSPFSGRAQNAAAVPITNASWGLDPEGDFVVITYDLQEPRKGEVDIALVLRRSSKPSEKLKPKVLVGHFGDNVEPGKKRKIYWHYKRDKITGLSGEGWYFELTADWNGDDYTVATRTGTFTPPSLRIESLKFWGPQGTPELDAEESGEITFIVSNAGRGPARKVALSLTPVQGEEMKAEKDLFIGDILPGGAMRGKLRVTASSMAPDQTVTYRIDAADSARYDTTSAMVEFRTRKLLPPRLVLAEQFVRSSRDGIRRPIDAETRLFRGDTAHFFLKIRNDGAGEAESAYVNLALRNETDDLTFASGRRSFLVKSFKMDGTASPKGLLAGGSTIIDFSVFAGPACRDDSMVVDLLMTERRPRFVTRDSVVLRITTRPPTFQERADAYIRRGAYDSLIVLGTREAAARPDSAEAYYYLGVAYEQRKDVRSASVNYQKAADRGHVAAAQWLKGKRVKEVVRVSYRPLTPNPFEGFSGTIGLGIGAFAGSGAGELETTLYEKLRTTPEVTRRFGLYSHDALRKSIKTASVDPADPAVMKTLGTALAIRFLVTGKRIDERSFNIRILRTSDGAAVLEKEMRNSEGSTALADVVTIFQSGRVPVYRTESVLEDRKR
jgi:hypothetical protein